MADEPIDEIAPWTIKAVATRIRQKVMTAAKKEGLTAGQWLERRVDEWEADGSPTLLQTQANPGQLNAAATVAATASYISACAAAKAAGLKVDEQAFGRMQKGAEAAVRAAQGLPPLAVRVPPRLAITSLTAPPAKQAEPEI